MPRFNESKTIYGTHKLHTFIPISENRLLTKPFSSSAQIGTEIITKVNYLTPTDLQKIESGYVTVVYDKSWWLACILQRNDENEFTVSFLHPKGPSPSFCYPKPKDILTVPSNSILQVVNPVTATGRVYTLSEPEISVSLLALERFLRNQD